MGRDLEINGNDRPILACSRRNFVIRGGNWTVRDLLEEIEELTTVLKNPNGDVGEVAEAIAVYSFALNEAGGLAQIDRYEIVNKMIDELEEANDFWGELVFANEVPFEIQTPESMRMFLRYTIDQCICYVEDEPKIEEAIEDPEKIDSLLERYQELTNELERRIKEQQEEWLDRTVEIHYD